MIRTAIVWQHQRCTIRATRWPTTSAVPLSCNARRRKPAYPSSCTVTHHLSSTSADTSTSISSKPSKDARSQDFLLGSSLSRLLTNEQRKLLRQVHQLSSMSRSLAKQVGNVPVREDSLLADIARLQMQRKKKMQHQAVGNGNTRQQLEEVKTTELDDEIAPPSLFTVVFAGEFNSGKSTLINALLGAEILESGVLPTTDAITILMASNEEEHFADVSNDLDSTDAIVDFSAANSSPAHSQLHLLPSSKYPILSDLCLIDTPGTNAILALQHTYSTLRILHDADLIVFVTSADRPFSESEKQLLQTSILSYRKRVVMVINKMDILERQQGEDHGEKTKQRVVDYVVEHAGDLLGARPVVIPLSARDALSVKSLYSSQSNKGGSDEQPTLWKRSNFATLEHYLQETLTASSKIKTKILNPLGVAEGILLDCQNEIYTRKDELEIDVMTLRLLNSQTAAWDKEIQSEVLDRCRSEVRDVFAKRAQVVSKVLDQLSLIDRLRMGLGLGKTSYDNAWENANIQTISLENELNAIVGEYSDTLSSRTKTQGEATLEYLGKRPAVVGSKGAGRMIGTVSAPKFKGLREDLRSSTTTAIQTLTSRLPPDGECSDRVYSSLCRNALTSTFLCSSAIAPSTLAFLEMIDSAMGVTMSTLLFALGGLALPIGSKRVAGSYEKEWLSYATKLDSSLDIVFSDTMKRVRMQLSESIAPYSRYITAEGDWLLELQTKTESGTSTAHRLRNQTNKACDS